MANLDRDGVRGFLLAVHSTAPIEAEVQRIREQYCRSFAGYTITRCVGDAGVVRKTAGILPPARCLAWVIGTARIECERFLQSDP